MADTPSSSAPETPKYELPPERQDEDFQPIAQLVTPNPPEWFSEYLHHFYWSVWRISVLGDEQPSRAELLRTLAKLKNAAEVLMNALGRPVASKSSVPSALSTSLRSCICWRCCAIYTIRQEMRLNPLSWSKWTVERGQGKAALLPSKQYLREPIAPS